MGGCCAFNWCGDKNLKEVYAKPEKMGPLTLWFPEGTTWEQRLLLVTSSLYQLNCFQNMWGAISRPVDVYYHNTETIPCGNREGDFWGCHYGENGPIHIIMGEYFTSSVLFHELIHHNHNRDHEHEDPRWDTEWRPRQNEILRRLRKKHKDFLKKT